MKLIHSVLTLLILFLVFCFQTVTACTISIEPFRKSFRRAKAVFLAEVKEIKPRSNVDYNNDWVDGDITFEIFDSWKGNYKDRVILSGNTAWSCGCNNFDQFKSGQKYIVFVDKQSNANFCDSYKSDTENGLHKIKQLDSFWFRTWARIYPF